jgi:TonB family protein
MEPLQLSPLAPQPSVKLQIPALDLASGDLAIAAVGKPFSAPLGTGSPVIPGALGTDAQGFIEVVPYSTRKPNVPELAWTNKISGWVLVAFNVSPTGHTRNVRILDARPRGVFEETVISAVSDWRYTIRSAGPIGGEIVMTQKVDVDWQDFPLNIPNVD